MSVFSQAPYEKSETTLCFLSVTFADKIQAPLMELQWGGIRNETSYTAHMYIFLPELLLFLI